MNGASSLVVRRQIIQICRLRRRRELRQRVAEAEVDHLEAAVGVEEEIFNFEVSAI